MSEPRNVSNGAPLPLAVLRPCEGDAHDNPYIDNCLRCAPEWGFTVHCSQCGVQLEFTTHGELILTCPHCGTRHANDDYGFIWRSRNPEAL